MDDFEDKKVSKQLIAKLFGVSTRRIEQLKADGIIQSEGRPAKFDLYLTIQSYIKYLSDKANGREKKKQDSELETEKLEAETRIKQAKAEMAELELKELRGEMHRAEDVEAITVDHVLFTRSMLLALPGKLAMDLSGNHTAAEQSERVKVEVTNILNRLSEYQYDADEYAKRVRDRQGWKDKEENE